MCGKWGKSLVVFTAVTVFSIGVVFATEAIEKPKVELPVAENSRGTVELTTLMYVTKRGSDAQKIKALISLGADVNAKDRNGKTALIYAAWLWKNPETIRELLKAGAEVNIKDKNGRSAIMFIPHIVRESDIETLNLLLKAGAELNAKDKEGYTVLTHAVKAPVARKEIVKELLKNGADINAKDKEGYTVLVHALVQQQLTPDPELTIIRELLKSGADVNVKNDKWGGFTPLIFASRESNNPEIITLLVKSGADAGVKDKNGKTALDYAKENEKIKNSNAIETLKKAMREEK
jgi:ankyrin repeat protein